MDKDKKYILLGGVFVIVVALLLIMQLTDFNIIKFPETCMYKQDAIDRAIELEATTDETCMLFNMKVARGGCHSCSDPNIMGFDGAKTYNVLCSNHWESNGWIMTKNNVEVILDNDCIVDTDCNKLRGLHYVDWGCNDAGSFSDVHEFTCVEGFCKAYYTVPETETPGTIPLDDGDDDELPPTQDGTSPPDGDIDPPPTDNSVIWLGLILFVMIVVIVLLRVYITAKK